MVVETVEDGTGCARRSASRGGITMVLFGG